MSELRDLLGQTAGIAGDFLEGLDERPVVPAVDVAALREALGGDLPEGPTDPREVIAELAANADPGLSAMPSGRWFGFVIGGVVPAALAADWLTSTWDQNAMLFAASPPAAIAEEVAGTWLKELLGIPSGASVGFVTGCQMAHVTALAAARFHLLHAAGWDLARDGLYGAPRIRVIAAEKRHVTLDRALRLLGMGAPELVGADGQGRMVVEDLELDERPTIVCAQVGEVNTGARDDVAAIVSRSRESKAWVHVDGAFGLWAAASPRFRQLVAGCEQADSWATDAHKWLNVPYDCGLAFCAHPESHHASMSVRADYLVGAAEEDRNPMDWTPEASRRARGFAVYAAIRSLGRSGVAELVEQACDRAQEFADGFRELGAEVLNEVVLNQVLIRFDSDERTNAVLQAVQQSGEAWMGGTIWDGRAAIRISVSNWQTSDQDVERTLAAYRDAVGASSAA